MEQTMELNFIFGRMTKVKVDPNAKVKTLFTLLDFEPEKDHHFYSNEKLLDEKKSFLENEVTQTIIYRNLRKDVLSTIENTQDPYSQRQFNKNIHGAITNERSLFLLFKNKIKIINFEQTIPKKRKYSQEDLEEDDEEEFRKVRVKQNHTNCYFPEEKEISIKLIKFRNRLTLIENYLLFMDEDCVVSFNIETFEMICIKIEGLSPLFWCSGTFQKYYLVSDSSSLYMIDPKISKVVSKFPINGPSHYLVENGNYIYFSNEISQFKLDPKNGKIQEDDFNLDRHCPVVPKDVLFFGDKMVISYFSDSGTMIEIIDKLDGSIWKESVSNLDGIYKIPKKRNHFAYFDENKIMIVNLKDLNKIDYIRVESYNQCPGVKGKYYYF